jgi:hypothetical protein
MIEHDELTMIPNIKDSSKSTIHYRSSVEVARDNYCDTLMAYISDVNFIRPPTFDERKRKLDEQLFILENICKRAFYEIYREY